MTTGFFAAKEEKPKELHTEIKQLVTEDDEKTTRLVTSATTSKISLLDQVRAATDDGDIKTTGFFTTKTTSDESKKSDTSLQNEPPVGWLVCIAGKNIGEDYRIVAGKNSIGRTQENDISLSNETSVSREKHAWIIYEPRKREFFLKPGDGNGLVYINDDNVFDTTMLHNGDIVELGNVKLIFVALCGPSFNWADFINKE